MLQRPDDDRQTGAAVRPDARGPFILILSQPSSGSSMVAGLFARHGVWTGTPHSPTLWDGEPCYENKLLKRDLIDRYGRMRTGMTVEPGGEHVMFMIEADGYEKGPYLFKCSALYWPAFIDAGPILVTVRRPVESIRKSIDNEALHTLIDEQTAALDMLESKLGALRIDSPQLIAGDFEQARAVFAACGIEFNETIARDVVRPHLWHN